jgi:hypothetical protein
MTPSASQRRLISPEHIEAEGGPSRQRQAKLRMTGEFCPHVKIGGRVYYTVEDWESFLASQRRRSTSELAPAAA